MSVNENDAHIITDSFDDNARRAATDFPAHTGYQPYSPTGGNTQTRPPTNATDAISVNSTSSGSATVAAPATKRQCSRSGNVNRVSGSSPHSSSAAASQPTTQAQAAVGTGSSGQLNQAATEDPWKEGYRGESMNSRGTRRPPQHLSPQQLTTAGLGADRQHHRHRHP